MPSLQRHLLPLWEPSSSANATERTEEATTSMILIAVPPALESALRAVVRYLPIVCFSQGGIGH